MKARKVPTRTCIACRTVSGKREFVRLVRDSAGDTSVDPTGRARGRGAYLCPTIECFDTALSKRRMEAALRVRLKQDDVDRLRRDFESLLSRYADSQQGR